MLVKHKYHLTMTVLIFIVGGCILGYLYWWLPTQKIRSVESREVKVKEKEQSEEIPFWKSPMKVFIRPEERLQTDTFDIFVRDESSGKETFLMRLDADASHYHFGEYHNGNLYIIRKFGYDPKTTTYSEDYTRELWRYDKEGKGKRLFSAKSIDFRVDPKERFVAIGIREKGDETFRDILYILDLATNKERLNAPVERLVHPDIPKAKALPSMVILEYWSGDGRFFWGSLDVTAYPYQFFKVDTTNWEITKYDVSSLALGCTECALNPNLERIIYSNAPETFCIEEAQDFERSWWRRVTLWLYDLNSGKKEIIDKSRAEWFRPEWLDNDTIEYTKKGKRIRRDITWSLTSLSSMISQLSLKPSRQS
ncbi:hypothetical protein KKC52_12750 [bacterium]|nr:hypothetical protein [bacterium]